MNLKFGFERKVEAAVDSYVERVARDRIHRSGADIYAAEYAQARKVALGAFD